MRCGSINYCTEQGIGYLAKSFYDAGVVTDFAIMHHSSRVNHTEWYPPGTQMLARRPFDWPEIRAWVDQLDVMLFFETPFDWSIINYCRSKGIKTVIMPMYECTPRHLPAIPDTWACPSLLDVDVFRDVHRFEESYGAVEFVPVPIPPVKWAQRTRARRFLHNGGNLGLRGHKGTLEILKAMQFVKSPIELRVRAQDDRGLLKLIREVPSITSDDRVKFTYGEVPKDMLFNDDHDVFIMAEKYNGLSLPLSEARAAGMLVMTSDRYPMNTWLPREYLIPVSGYQRAAISGAFMEYDEAIVRPEDIAAKIDEVYDANITAYSKTGIGYAAQHSFENLKDKWLEVLS